MERQYKLIGLSGLQPIPHKPGRLSHEYNQDKEAVMVNMIAAISKAHQTMSLTPEPKKIKEAAEAAIKKIMEVYPSALIDDILKALEMASFGEIKLDDQLTTISAANIFGWYKKFRMDFGHLSKACPPPPPKEVVEYYANKKHEEAVAFYREWLFEPEKSMFGLHRYYDRLIEWKFIDPLPEFKTKVFNEVLAEFCKDMDPARIYTGYPDFKERNLVKEMIQEFTETRKLDFKKYKGTKPFEKLAERAKLKVIEDSLKICNKNEIIQKIAILLLQEQSEIKS
jgi:hypothetical protein